MKMKKLSTYLSQFSCWLGWHTPTPSLSNSAETSPMFWPTTPFGIAAGDGFQGLSVSIHLPLTCFPMTLQQAFISSTRPSA
jgi:hypothetical protein